MNLKTLKAELRGVEKMDPHVRLSHFEAWRAKSPLRVPALVETVFRAIHSGTDDFRKYELPKLPPWTLRLVRLRIAKPAEPRDFSTTKLKALDAAIRKAEASLCCPYCQKKFTAPGLPGHCCHAAPEVTGERARFKNGSRPLTALEQHVARKRAGLPESVRLSRQVAFDLEKIRRCRVCGCIDLDCEECIRRTGEPCSWVEADLCSACVAGSESGVKPPQSKAPRGKAVRK